MNVHLLRSTPDEYYWKTYFPYDTHRWWEDSAKHSRLHKLSSLNDSDIVIVTDTEVGRKYFGAAYNKSVLSTVGEKPSFVYDQSDIPITSLPGLYTSLAKYQLWRGYVVPVPYIGTYTQIIFDKSDWDHPNRPVLWTFAGGCGQEGFIGYAARKRILSLNDDRAVLRDTTYDKMWDFSGECDHKKVDNQNKMVTELRSSKFTVCPGGGGVGSFRLFEAMKSGSVPVIISDYWAEVLPVKWADFSLRVSESQIEELPEILRREERNWERYQSAMHEVVSNYLTDTVLFDYLIGCTNRLTSKTILTSDKVHNLVFRLRRKIFMLQQVRG